MSHNTPYELRTFSMIKEEKGDKVTATLLDHGKSIEIKGEAYGSLGAFINALEQLTGRTMRVLNYNEHALSKGTRAEAMAYIELDVDGEQYVGVSTSQDTVSSMFKATLSALNAGIEASQPQVKIVSKVA